MVASEDHAGPSKRDLLDYYAAVWPPDTSAGVITAATARTLGCSTYAKGRSPRLGGAPRTCMRLMSSGRKPAVRQKR